jgi:hypothetical protein
MAIYLMGGASLYLSLIIQSVSDNCIMRKETALGAQHTQINTHIHAYIYKMYNEKRRAEKDERVSVLSLSSSLYFALLLLCVCVIYTHTQHCGNTLHAAGKTIETFSAIAN